MNLKIGWAIGKEIAHKGAIVAKTTTLKLATILTKAYNSSILNLKIGWAIGKEIAHKGAIVAKTTTLKLVTILTKAYNSSILNLRNWLGNSVKR